MADHRFHHFFYHYFYSAEPGTKLYFSNGRCIKWVDTSCSACHHACCGNEKKIIRWISSSALDAGCRLACCTGDGLDGRRPYRGRRGEAFLKFRVSNYTGMATYKDYFRM